MTEEMFDLFEDYLNNNLDEQARNDFEKKLDQSEEWKNQFEKYKVVHFAIESSVEDDLKNSFSKIDAERRQGGSYNKYWILASIIAGLLIVGFSILKLTNDINPSQIAQEYSVDDPLQVTRGIEPTPKDSLVQQQYLTFINSAKDLMKENKYEEARLELEKITLNSPLAEENKEWMKALTYYLQNGRTDPEFQRILNSILDNPKHNCYNLAVDMDSKVNSFWGRLKN